jgi:hypothetical protein
MFNKVKVTTGIVIFLFIVSVPLWKKIFSAPVPVIALEVPEGTHCVEDREYMRTSHMDLLNKWRNEAVRNNNKTYVNSKGQHFKKSLTGTCLSCHKSKENFCDSCHKSADVKPYCFDCHVTGQEGKTNPDAFKPR